ncbi:MAG: hypothetical protein OXR62_12220 [Ahrensia sp.]|nr:hypothetical protein [Ahrensia sp.]
MMIDDFQHYLTISIADQHLWCPSPFTCGERLFVAVAAWPHADFEGWRNASKLHLFEITSLEDSNAKAIWLKEFRFEGSIYGSLINPRIMRSGNEFHLFCSGVVDSIYYEIAHALVDLKADNAGTLSTLTIAGDGIPQGGQGPTNPAPVHCADGVWRMLFRVSTKVGGQRSLYAAQADDPASRWNLIGAEPIIQGDLEDPFVWQDGTKHKALVRDIGGTVSGFAWPTIGMMETDDWTQWRPAPKPHVSNRSIPQENGSIDVMYRLERPACLRWRGNTLMFFACLAKKDTNATIRVLALPAGNKGEG